VHPRVSFDVNPTTRGIVEQLALTGHLASLVHAGARLHQTGCNGCIGMGQAPATGQISLRTVPRNFPGRSGTKEDRVYLCSPETATASALTGVITDPRTLGMPYPRFVEPAPIPIDTDDMLVRPDGGGRAVELRKGPNIRPLPGFEPLPDTIEGTVLLVVGDDVSTDEIMPAGARVLPYRSNVPEIARFAFAAIDEGFYERALAHRERGFFVVGGRNYGQGSSREHAALAPRFLGLRAVLASSFARIHEQNLVDFGILPLTFARPEDYPAIERGDVLELTGVRAGIERGDATLTLRNRTKNHEHEVRLSLSPRQREILLAGGVINHVRAGRR
jgi:aconitate hydratase